MNTAISTVAQAETRTSSDARKYLPLLMLLFAGSGCAALIYEVVWYQLLQLAIGSTSVSLGILLATFMGGLCIGSIWLPRLQLRQHPLKIYAALEFGIGLFAVFVQLSLPYLNRAYVSGAEHGLPGMLLRGLLAAICMLPPTILMGGSLPAITRWIEGSPEGVSWWGYLYGGNTAGAVFGCLLAGFYLLRVFNMATATYVAVAVNLGVAGLSLLVAGATPFSAGLDPAAEKSPAASGEIKDRPWQVYATIALSGATALGAEVVWTRTLAMELLATVYVFSVILAVFLTGLAIGSWAGSRVLRKMNPAVALGWSQILLTLGIAWTAYTMIHSLPWWNDDVLTTPDAWRMYSLDLKRVFYAVLPATIFWGASFPLACAAVARPDEDSGKVAGGIYAANTLGGIVGALAVSLSLIPWIGSQNTQRLLVIVSALSGLLVLFPYLRRSITMAVSTALALIAVVFLATTVSPIPTQLVAYGRFMSSWAGQSTDLKMVEGRNSSVAYTKWNDGAIYVNVNGHVEATTELSDMKLQRMVGHLPGVLHPNPQKILGIGFGAGVSAGTFTRYPSVKSITICEIEPVIPPNSTYYFGDQNYRVMNDPRTKIVYDDARHFLLTTTEKYDIIASDPLDVFVKGTAALYSEEYFNVVKQHLNPGGYFTLYVPLYETSEATIKSELLTFFKAFPNGTIWANNRDGEGYDMVFLGEIEPLKIDVDAAQDRLKRPDYDKVRESLAGIDVHSLPDLLSVYTGNATDLDPWIRGAAVNHDGDLRLSYLAGWGINSQIADSLYRQMVQYRHDPTSMLTGSKPLEDAVINAIHSGPVE
ncbi:MAG TPA: fused MFS/spermidine synthase [Candidatus Acidoferrales bacterium]|nr:fused MFS/spermidine synthase [Candidatus Acidoferrales bacterium]